MTTLKKIYQQHKGKVSDKWSLYLDSYDKILSNYRSQPINMLEIGVQNGGSLEIWAKYFPHAQHIIGCDIHPKCGELQYDDQRIQVIIGNAIHDITQQHIAQISPNFDIIIDDGSHTSSDIIHTFARYFNQLNDGGIFIFEDLHCSYWQRYEGGLYHPHSAIAFFKNLIDIINYEHWGLPAERNEVLRDFYQTYHLQSIIDLDHIHSIEFINSMCVITKRSPIENELGTRLIVGDTAIVETQVTALNGSKSTPIDQSITPYPISPHSKIKLLKEEILRLKTELSISEQNKQTLQNQLQQLVQQHSKYKKLWTISLFKPLVQTELAISSANRYRKGFQRLVHEKGSIGKAYQTCQHTYQTSGIRSIKALLRQQHLEKLQEIKTLPMENAKDGFVILATKHTRYIAQLFNHALKKVHIESTILLETPQEGYSNKWHIVICPQIFETLPTHYLAFQMEQSVSSEWFTEAYFQRLHQAAHVFDYSINNIAYLQEHQLPFKKLHYLPVGILPSLSETHSQEFEYDIAFYGNPSCERRQLFLKKLSEKFSVKVISEVFGDELYDLLKKSKIVVNIHYYENALLETTRIYECLSLNKLVISEKGRDQYEHTELNGIVDFVEISDIDAMIQRIEYWLNHPHHFDTRSQAISNFQQQPDPFQFYLYRFLLSQDLIDFDTFYRLSRDYIQPQGDFWCLSLPESVAKRQDFNRDNHYNIWVFSGLRHNIDWVGYGLSYKFMMRVAEDLGMPQVTICEDDVLFNDTFKQRYTHIKQTLTTTNEPWDVYSGLIADLSENTEIVHSPIHSNHENFYGINLLASTIFNIYNHSAYSKIYSWDENNRLSHNTIDRYIQQQGGIRGVITSPFLVGHKEELFSTLTGTPNTLYKDMIAQSQNLLEQKIAKLEHKP